MCTPRGNAARYWLHRFLDIYDVAVTRADAHADAYRREGWQEVQLKDVLAFVRARGIRANFLAGLYPVRNRREFLEELLNVAA